MAVLIENCKTTPTQLNIFLTLIYFFFHKV